MDNGTARRLEPPRYTRLSTRNSDTEVGIHAGYRKNSHAGRTPSEHVRRDQSGFQSVAAAVLSNVLRDVLRNVLRNVPVVMF